MKQILVKIETDNDFCGNCHALGWVALRGDEKYDNPSCGVFNEDLDSDRKYGIYRCQSCLDAETREE